MKRTTIENQLTGAQVMSVVEGQGSKSSKIKVLFDGGVEVGEIAKLLDIRYNFVYNVVSNYCAINGIPTEMGRSAGSGKKEQVAELLAQGKSVKEIAIELHTHMNYIYKIKKELGAVKEAM